MEYLTNYPKYQLAITKKKKKNDIISFEKIVSKISFLPLIEPLSVNRGEQKERGSGGKKRRMQKRI